MDSNEINLLAIKLGIHSFLGVFAADQLDNLEEEQTGVLICNTEPSYQSGRHWVGLCITKYSVIYFDSLNTNFFKSNHIKKMLNKFKKPFLKNNIQIQANNSDKCGIHSLVFCYIMSRKNSKKTFMRFLDSFSSHKVSQREKLSLNYFLVIA